LRAAVGLAETMDVAVISKVHPVRSHSGAAQGGINAALANAPDGRHDSPEQHTQETIAGSDYLADQTAVARMCRLAPEAIYELEHWGAPFSRLADGTIAQRPFGAAGAPRTCYAADRTGHVLLQTLYEQAVKRGITVYDDCMVAQIAVEDGQYHGLVVYDLKRGRFTGMASRFCVLATGGYGRVYRNSTNALINTGSGIGAALSAGVEVKDLEFVQFHPTTQFGTNILITEGARGEGGTLLNAEGRRFMERYAPKMMELAPRDIVARAIQTEIQEGRGFDGGDLGGGYVQLDLRHLGREKIRSRLPGIREICLDFGGLDPVDEPIPVQPGQHYSMGGIDCDATGKTRVENLYAAGECACVSVHGANRLGGNSLLDTVVFGRLAAEAIDERQAEADFEPSGAVVRRHVETVTEKVEDLLGRGNGGVSYAHLRERLRNVLTEKVGIFRSEEELAEAVHAVHEIRRQYRDVSLQTPPGPFSFEILHVLELEGLIYLGQITAEGALAREESRGSHYRTDHTQRDDPRWLKHTVARLDGEEIAYRHSEVDLSLHEPEPRKY